MYWDDHSPPHFHAKYGEYEITVNILNGIVEGMFPKVDLSPEYIYFQAFKNDTMLREIFKKWGYLT